MGSNLTKWLYICGVIILVLCLIISARVDVKVDAYEKDRYECPLKIVDINRKYGTYWYAYIIVDEETGVNYVCTTQPKGGVAITPRLDENGDIYVNEVK